MTAEEWVPEFSVVIPAYNEEELLPRVMASINAAKQTYRLGSHRVEVILADNSSTDATATVARDAGALVATVEKRRIAAARNGGAAVARGQTLSFIDADTVMHPETFNVIHDAMATGRYAGGATGWKMERNSLGLATTRFFVRTFVTIPLRFEGGVVFCSREAFDAVGGYDESKDIAEDEAFFRAVRKYGKRRGLRMKIGTPPATATISARKFDEHGDWHMFFMPFWPITKRLSMKQIVEEYWYSRER